ncbi:hypothetical protein FACS1894187_04000 [Synergistales bacterium]|nr:hypothetical protein FACS1894187_04000 [Synergistales bacterium]
MRKTRVLGLSLLLTALIFAGCAEALSEYEYYYYDYEHFHYYQLRDVSVRGGHTLAGAQWFATIKDWFSLWDATLPEGWESRPDTEGGQAPGVPMVTSADLLSDFNGVYMEDPEQYRGNYHGSPPIYPDDFYYFIEDLNFDPIGSVYLVMPEGQGKLKIDFGNDYSSHYPPSNIFGVPQEAMEDILVDVPGFITSVKPNKPQLVSADRFISADIVSGVPVDIIVRDNYLHTETTFSAEDPQNYGSSLGYLTFRQSASFDVNFTGYRESIKIPFVVANVYDGPASDSGNELYFDMSLFEASGDVNSRLVTRKKFRWGVDENLTQDLGRLFMIQSRDIPTYRLETKVTNRTGVRYRQQRYDELGRDIVPRHWSYDIPDDRYGTLPKTFPLDPQSQIAPGLVTHYATSFDISHSRSESFRLYPFDSPSAARKLELIFHKVPGMTSYGTISRTSWSVTGFHMAFADVAREDTEAEIAQYTGVRPEMPSLDYEFSGVGDTGVNFGSDARSYFTINTSVPENLQMGRNESGDIVSRDVAALLPLRARMAIHRNDAIELNDEQWNNLSDPLNSASVVDELAKTYAIWVRSPNAREKDLNLFTSLAEKGYDINDLMQAFTDDNYLYIDFIALLADAVSPLSPAQDKTAFWYVVKDDGISYLLFGDGKIDDAWNLSFYVAKNGPGPELTPDNPPNTNTEDGGGGGCSQGGASFALLALLAGVWFIKRTA